MKSSNFHIIVESAGREDLAVAIKLAFSGQPKVAHYNVERCGGPDGSEAIVFYWHDAGGHVAIKPLPYPMPPDGVIEMVWHWLDAADRGRDPDIDGSVRPDGFRVETNRSANAELFRVTAVWTLFGK